MIKSTIGVGSDAADGSAGTDGEGGFKAEPGRYHLYVSLACPWAHRTLIFEVELLSVGEPKPAQETAKAQESSKEQDKAKASE